MNYLDKLQIVYKNNKSKIQRFELLLNEYEKNFGKCSNYEFFSSPGRTEIIGNHTDHNFGKVVCSSIDLDTVAIACKNNEDTIRLISLEYNESYTIDLNNLDKLDTDSSSCTLVKGMLFYLKKFATINGFNIVVSSDVIASSGVSSSASFEMLIGSVINSLFNNNEIDILTIAKAGQYSENNYWNKSSGLLDQLACGYGGLIAIDFKDINNPIITKLESKQLEDKFDIVLVQTGNDHANLSYEYSTIPSEMISIANTQLRNIDKNYIINNFKEIRSKVSDRAILRAFHFFDENTRVDRLIDCMNNKDYDRFLKIVTESGNSSWKYLQNCYLSDSIKSQPIPICLCLTKDFVESKMIKSAYRVHGGGFAGVIMTIIDKDYTNEYIEYIQKTFNEKCHKISLRSYGAINFKNI